jgi:hypothetical protein
MSPGMTDNDLNTGEDCGTVYLATTRRSFAKMKDAIEAAGVTMYPYP